MYFYITKQNKYLVNNTTKKFKKKEKKIVFLCFTNRTKKR